MEIKNHPKRSKIEIIFKSIVRTVLTYECETLTMSKANEGKLRRFERRIVFGHYHDTTTKQNRIITNIKIKTFYYEYGIVQEIKFHLTLDWWWTNKLENSSQSGLYQVWRATHNFRIHKSSTFERGPLYFWNFILTDNNLDRK